MSKRYRPRGRIWIAWSPNEGGWAAACADRWTALCLLRNEPEGAKLFTMGPDSSGYKRWRAFLDGGPEPGTNCLAWPRKLVPVLVETLPGLSRQHAGHIVRRYILEGTGLGAELCSGQGAKDGHS